MIQNIKYINFKNSLVLHINKLSNFNVEHYNNYHKDNKSHNIETLLSEICLFVRLIDEFLSKHNENNVDDQWHYSVISSKLHYNKFEFDNKSIFTSIFKKIRNFPLDNDTKNSLLDKISKFIQNDPYLEKANIIKNEAKIFENITVISCNYEGKRNDKIVYFVVGINENEHTISFLSELFFEKYDVIEKILFFYLKADFQNYYYYSKQNKIHVNNQYLEQININSEIEKFDDEITDIRKYALAYYYEKIPKNCLFFKNISKYIIYKFYPIQLSPFFAYFPDPGPKRDFFYYKNIEKYLGDKEIINVEYGKVELRKFIEKTNIPFIISDENIIKKYKILDCTNVKQDSKFDWCYISTSGRFYITLNKIMFLISALKDIFKISELWTGEPGSGKTNKAIDQVIKNDDKITLIITPTYKAENLYRERLKNNLNVKYIQINYINKNSRYISNLDLSKYSAIIFDEISMYDIDHWLSIHILFSKYKEKIKFMFIGDENQIRPFSKVNILKWIKRFISEKQNQNIVTCDKICRFENKKKLSSHINLKKDLLRGRLDLKNNYSNFFKSYENISELIAKIKKISSEYTFLLAKNDGLLSVNNFNHNIFSTIDKYKVDDIVFASDSKYFFAGEKLKIKWIDIKGDRTTYFLESLQSDKTLAVDVFGKHNSYFDKGRAITVHRAQGMTLDNVAIVLTNDTLETYDWLYTAVTRAKKDLIIFHNGQLEKYFKPIKTINFISEYPTLRENFLNIDVCNNLLKFEPSTWNSDKFNFFKKISN
ncbi:AAA domain-containing protein [Mycoplasma testudineum]|uniref:AAA domain-containing protein n=1 Tax=Mycoplasma testudineum TaxID=244584 RepID=A0A4R6IH55_9MOLU|nr:ATP-dependent RecD-like DNA helicase [Mycoplasma testudineum]OYD26418.1 hypothetical protein CG473_04070 [Mycoplasma testudineum]TDO21256.1 AAA domain-containing protein [Mycoplasma testudineum]